MPNMIQTTEEFTLFVKKQVDEQIAVAVDPKEVEKMIVKGINKAVKKFEPLTMVKTKKGDKIAHKSIIDISKYLAARIPVVLYGEAGSGKTTVLTEIAEALKMDCYAISVNEQTSKVDFLGFVDAQGKTVITNFRRAYENGGMFIIDEIDAGNPNVLTVINSALSNDFMGFPDGMVKRHENCVICCTANTLDGATTHYIGRNVLDGATKDRFAFVYVGYDEIIEKLISPQYSELVTELRNYYKGKQILSTRLVKRLAQYAFVDKLTVEIVLNLANLQEQQTDTQLVAIIKKYIA